MMVVLDRAGEACSSKIAVTKKERLGCGTSMMMTIAFTPCSACAIQSELLPFLKISSTTSYILCSHNHEDTMKTM